MTSEFDLILVTSDDWCGAYINNILIEENHSISAFDLVMLLMDAGLVHKYLNCNSLQIAAIDPDWMENVGSLPKNFEQIPPEAFVD